MQNMIDVQSLPDNRQIAINAVGIRDIKHPIQFEENNKLQGTIANFSMTVALPGDVKGTHMSRFVELIHEWRSPITVSSVHEMALAMLNRLQADEGTLQMAFPIFLEKEAPVSKAKSLLDYDVDLTVNAKKGETETILEIAAPVTSLCPCSKKISDYGAHNQRSLVKLKVKATPTIDVSELIHVAEESASCALYGILKRPDEKYVTEKAYNNPKFVEDMVRDLAAVLTKEPRVKAFELSSENFESIHNHSAFASIRSEGW